MVDKLQEFVRESLDRLLPTLSFEERLKGVPAEERLKGLSLDEVLHGLSPEAMRELQRRLQAPKADQPEKSR